MIYKPQPDENFDIIAYRLYVNKKRMGEPVYLRLPDGESIEVEGETPEEISNFVRKKMQKTIYKPEMDEPIGIMAYRLYVKKKKTGEPIYLSLPDGKTIEVEGETQEEILEFIRRNKNG